MKFALIIASICLFAAAVMSPRFGMIYIVAAMLCLLVVGTSLSRAGRLSRSLQHLAGRRVEIRIWGQRFECEIDSIRALGDGLHLFVRRDGQIEHVKIAQPRMGECAQIAEAKYVQWSGKNCQRVESQPAVTFTIV